MEHVQALLCSMTFICILYESHLISFLFVTIHMDHTVTCCASRCPQHVSCAVTEVTCQELVALQGNHVAIQMLHFWQAVAEPTQEL